MVFVTRLIQPIVMGTNAGDLNVGTEVILNENGQPVNYLIVNQGIPENSPLYDASCEGTWLLRKDIAENRKWDSTGENDYEYSTIDNYLNSTFLNLFESNIRDAIKQVKIPYREGVGYGKTVTSGSSGLSTKIFLLSATEVGFNMSDMPTNEGVELAYFSGCADDGADNKRIAYLNSSATSWWLRSPYCNLEYGLAFALYVGNNGDWVDSLCTNSYGIRPALILPYEFKFTSDQISA